MLRQDRAKTSPPDSAFPHRCAAGTRLSGPALLFTGPTPFVKCRFRQTRLRGGAPSFALPRRERRSPRFPGRGRSGKNALPRPRKSLKHDTGSLRPALPRPRKSPAPPAARNKCVPPLQPCGGTDAKRSGTDKSSGAPRRPCAGTDAGSARKKTRAALSVIGGKARFPPRSLPEDDGQRGTLPAAWTRLSDRRFPYGKKMFRPRRRGQRRRPSDTDERPPLLSNRKKAALPEAPEHAREELSSDHCSRGRAPASADALRPFLPSREGASFPGADDYRSWCSIRNSAMFSYFVPGRP